MVKGLTACGLYGYSLVSVLLNRSIQYSWLFLNKIFLLWYMFIYTYIQFVGDLIHMVCTHCLSSCRLHHLTCSIIMPRTLTKSSCMSDESLSRTILMILCLVISASSLEWWVVFWSCNRIIVHVATLHRLYHFLASEWSHLMGGGGVTWFGHWK